MKELEFNLGPSALAEQIVWSERRSVFFKLIVGIEG